MKNFQIAIDGPAGSGKSSISNILAEEIGFIHVDTGAMYRAITHFALAENIDITDENSYSFLKDLEIKYFAGKVFANGVDVSKEVRLPNVSKNVPVVAAFKVVREKLLKIQRELAKTGNIILDGRDIGIKVLPNANLKIYLNASIKERAKRRYLELKNKGIDISLNKLIEDIENRDYADKNRKISPLKKADDAVEIDTTNISIEEVIEKIKMLVSERGFNHGRF